MKSRGFRRLVLGAAFAVVPLLPCHGVGVSFTYLFPRNGSFAHPIAPLSLSDIGVSFGKYLGLAASASLLRIGGLGITDSAGTPVGDGPVLGPLTTVRLSAYLKVTVPVWRLTFTAAGGGFGFYSILPRLIEGNLDRLIAASEGYDTVTSSMTFTNSPGYGLTFGGNVKVRVTDQVGIKAGAMYYVGRAPIRFSGSYVGAASAATAEVVTEVPSVLREVRVDFRGIEISLGADLEL